MKKVLAIVGPTASGKTKLSIEVAKQLNGEIISADSRQVYKYFPIASSQPSISNLKQIKHHFINELNPEKEFNAGEFGTKGRDIITEIFNRGKQPVIVGGSGLYIRSLIDGFFEEEIENKEVRDKIYEKLEKHGEEYLYAELKKIDNKTAAEIPPRKIRRVIRALEVYYATGKKISDLKNNKAKVDFTTVQTGLMFERKILYKRINERVDKMIGGGLLKEVEELKGKGYDYRKHYSIDTVGIKEVYKYFEGLYDYEEMLRLIKQNTRRYAKRQMTWFRGDKRIHWVEVREESGINELTEELIRIFLND